MQTTHFRTFSSVRNPKPFLKPISNPFLKPKCLHQNRGPESITNLTAIAARTTRISVVLLHSRVMGDIVAAAAATWCRLMRRNDDHLSGGNTSHKRMSEKRHARPKCKVRYTHSQAVCVNRARGNSSLKELRDRNLKKEREDARMADGI